MVQIYLSETLRRVATIGKRLYNKSAMIAVVSEIPVKGIRSASKAKPGIVCKILVNWY